VKPVQWPSLCLASGPWRWGVSAESRGRVQMSILGLIFLAATLVCGLAYWYVDKKMVFAIASLKDMYKLGLIIIYGTQLVLIFIFVL
jgi:hypothetical protein